MKLSFSVLDTPLTIQEFCRLAGITLSTYNQDFYKGLILRSCSPFACDRPNFRYSNFSDLVFYVFATKTLPDCWPIQIRWELTERILDEFIVGLEYETKELTISEIKSALKKSLLNDKFDRMTPQNSEDYILMNSNCDVVESFFECWFEKDSSFRNIIENEIF